MSYHKYDVIMTCTNELVIFSSSSSISISAFSVSVPVVTLIRKPYQQIVIVKSVHFMSSELKLEVLSECIL